MTTVAERDEKAERKEALKARAEDMAKREAELNSGRTGKGLRVFLGMTRGKNPQEIQYEGFDEAKPETLPANVQEFMETTAVSGDDPRLLDFLIRGFNDWSYEQASDPIAEHVEASWPEDIQKNFRMVVRNYVSATKCSIEDAVALIKPGINKALGK